MVGLLLWAAPAWAVPVEGQIRQRGDGAPIASPELRVGDTVVPVDADGRFTVDLPDGVESTLVAESPDHLPLTIMVTPPLAKPLKIYLRASPAPMEIVVEAFRPSSDMTRHHVDAEMAYETPGTFDDPVRLVQALPGVVVQREFAPSSGDVSVRGSLPGDSRTYLDGIEVPYLYHFNQYASVYPASQLSGIDFFPSSFGSRYGDATGAVIEATSDERAPSDFTGHASLSTVSLGLDAKGPTGKGWWFGGSVRRSFHDLAGRTSAQFPLWPVFYDFNVRATHTKGARAFTVFGMGAGDRYIRRVGELDVLDPVEQQSAPTLDYARNYQIAGVRWSAPGLRATTAFLHDVIDSRVDAGGHLLQRTFGLPTRVDTSGTVNDRLAWEAGGELKPEVMIAEIEDAGPYGALVVTEAAPLAWGVNASQTLTRARGAAYAELSARLGAVRLMPGLRVGLDTAGWSPTVEPRLAMRFRVAEQTELRLGGGRYQQRPETVQLLADPNLPTTSGWAATAGIEQTIAGRVEVLLDAHLKNLDDVVWQPAYGGPAVADRALSYGAELTLRYRLREVFFLWAWAAYGRSYLYDDAEIFPSRADQPFAGGVVASWNIKPQLNVAVRYRAASGLPYDGIDGSVYDGTADTWLPRFGAPNDRRLPFYHKVDLHVGYTFVFRKWSLDTALELWIVPPGAAALYPTWNHDYTEEGFVGGPVALPLFSLRASW